MSERCHTMGLVIRARREQDVVLTLLTPELGRITVIAKGAKSLKGPQLALSQMFCYGNFELYRKGELYWLATGELTDNFYGVTSRLDALNLASYFCEVAYGVSDAGVPAEALLRLLLNCLYFVANQTYPDDMIKGVFEWRVLAMQGVFPSVNGCARCGARQDVGFALDVPQGELICSECRAKQSSLPSGRMEEDAPRHDCCLLSSGALAAIRFSLSEPLSRLMSFRLTGENELRDFTVAGEKFLRYHLEIDSMALHMYEQMKSLGAMSEKKCPEAIKETEKIN